MESIFTNQTISMSEFKKNPASVVKRADGRPVAVLSHNKPAFYMVEPKLFEALIDDLADKELAALVRQRLGSKQQAIEVDIDTV